MLTAELRTRAPLGPLTSLKVGGPADYFLAAGNTDELADGLRWAHAQGLPARVIGGGSNLLIADAGVEGLVIKATGTRTHVVERNGPVLVADAGVTFANIARKLAKEGLGGLEWATNVPGTVGGAAVNNAGAFGGDTASRLVALTLVDARGEIRRLTADELAYAYRTSRLKRRELGDVAVTQVELALKPGSPEAIMARVAEYQALRTSSQPRRLSAGSVFANPEGGFAGQLIEAAGLKGTRVGGAEISTHHANFFVNLGGATAADVYALVRQAQAAVFERFGVWLRPEIELLGRWSRAERTSLQAPGTLSNGH